MKNIEEINAIIKICKEDNLPEELMTEYLSQEEINEEQSEKCKNKKHAKNKWITREKDNKRIQKLIDANGYFYSEKENEFGIKYYTRFYLSGCRKLAKKMTNRKLRKSYTYVPKGAFYRKVFDYDNTLF